MGPLDTLWHLLNFFAPAFGVGLLAPAMAKLLWRRRLGPVGWTRLFVCTIGGAAAALLVGLGFFGRDGRVATYVMTVLGSALALWWAGFVRAR